MLRAILYYAASVGLLSLFSCEVCPYIESLGRATMAVLYAAFFGGVLLLRPALERLWVTSQPPLLQPRRQFLLDFGSFVAVGLLLTAFDRIVYGFPIGSGMKALLGALSVGLFFGADSALQRERMVMQAIRAATESGGHEVRPFSLTRKFMLVALGTLAMVALDVAFLALRDLQSLSGVGPARRDLLLESGLVLAFFFPLTVNLIVSFAGNLRLFLENQRLAMEQVASGRFDVRVPVASTDEFGTIARHTNQMIATLSERERMRNLFGKLLSPAIAQRLLAQDGLKLGGTRRRVVVLFSDVRNFTTRTEHADPEALVSDLNRYFGRMVELVDQHGGIVDKFIGDGLMAVFGLERPEQGANDGVSAARAMLEAVEALNRELTSPISIGIGLHQGEVIAGTIGSPARLEFTFIGDTVNVAARIEGLTKALGSALLISSTVLEALRGEQAAWKWNACGPQALKGRSARVEVYSLARAEVPDGSSDNEDSLPGLT